MQIKKEKNREMKRVYEGDKEKEGKCGDEREGIKREDQVRE